jgi:hypothetical protein
VSLKPACWERAIEKEEVERYDVTRSKREEGMDLVT